ncbi:MAG: SDR family NAD(P)-dependent oxidoreductase [Vicinamibacterales bacterium]
MAEHTHSAGGTTTGWAHRYGPWALVTGASDGIGQAMSREAARRGLHVVLVARRRVRLEALAREIASPSTDVLVVDADLSDASGVNEVLRRVADLDIGLFAACAGFGTSGPFLNADPDRSPDARRQRPRRHAHDAGPGHRMRTRPRRRRADGILVASRASLAPRTTRPPRRMSRRSRKPPAGMAPAWHRRAVLRARSRGLRFRPVADMHITRAVSAATVAGRRSMRSVTGAPSGPGCCRSCSRDPLALPPRAGRTRILEQVMRG